MHISPARDIVLIRFIIHRVLFAERQFTQTTTNLPTGIGTLDPRSFG
jgi:hypothetical protein